MRFTDPTGHIEEDCVGNSMCGVSSLGYDAYEGYESGGGGSDYYGSVSTGLGYGGYETGDNWASDKTTPAQEQQAYASKIVTEPSAFVDFSGVSTDAQIAGIAKANGWQEPGAGVRTVSGGPYAGATYNQTSYKSLDGLQEVRVHDGIPGFADPEIRQMRWTYAVESGTAGASDPNQFSRGLSFRSLDINSNPVPFNSDEAHISLLANIERFADVLSGRWR